MGSRLVTVLFKNASSNESYDIFIIFVNCNTPIITLITYAT